MGLVAFVLAVVQHVKTLPWNILICFHVFHVAICREPQLMIVMFEFRAFPKRMSWHIMVGRSRFQMDHVQRETDKHIWCLGISKNHGLWIKQALSGGISFGSVLQADCNVSERSKLASQTPNSFGCRQSSRWPIPEPRNVWAPVLWVLATAVF